MIKVVDATVADVKLIKEIAERTWWTAYGKLLSAAQIRYMLDELYSEVTLTELILSKKQQFIVLDDGGIQGFAARPEDPLVYKVHKLYVLPENHRKGYGVMLLNNIVARLVSKKIHTLELNVYRQNNARSFYEKFGFKVIREENFPMGPYWINDFVMRFSF